MRKRRGFRGSYTVEASLVMAMVLTVTAALLITAFYLHDRAVLQAGSCEAAAAGCNAATEKERQTMMTRAGQRITAARLLGSRQLQAQISAEKRSVRAGWSGKYPVPGIAGRLLANGNLEIEVSWESEIIQPADTIRKIRGIRKLANGGGV